MSKATEVDWRKAHVAPVVLLFGPEDYTASSAIRSIRAELRAKHPELEIHEIDASVYGAGYLTALASPSLFGEPKLIIVRGFEKCSDDFIDDVQNYVSSPDPDTTLILRHTGSSVRGKKALDAIRASGSAIEVKVPEMKKEPERIAFVQSHFAHANRKVNPNAVRALVLAFGEQLAELAAAADQLMLDEAETITEEVVDRYFGGRVEVSSFKVADLAIAGQAGHALAMLRHALATGVDPVPMVIALSTKIRQMAKVYGNRGATPASLGMPPWLLDQTRRSLAGWSEEGLANVFVALADTDAAVKGAARDPEFALEQLIALIANRGLHREAE